MIKEGKADGKTLRKLEAKLEEVDAQVVGMVRNAFRVSAPSPGRVLREGDILVLEAEPESLSGILSNLGLELEAEEENESETSDAAEDAADAKKKKKEAESDDVELQELVAMPTSDLIGRSTEQLNLRAQHNLNLLALSREGMRSIMQTPIQHLYNTYTDTHT